MISQAPQVSKQMRSYSFFPFSRRQFGGDFLGLFSDPARDEEDGDSSYYGRRRRARQQHYQEEEEDQSYKYVAIDGQGFGFLI